MRKFLFNLFDELISQRPTSNGRPPSSGCGSSKSSQNCTSCSRFCSDSGSCFYSESGFGYNDDVRTDPGLGDEARDPGTGFDFSTSSIRARA